MQKVAKEHEQREIKVTETERQETERERGKERRERERERRTVGRLPPQFDEVHDVICPIPMPRPPSFT